MTHTWWTDTHDSPVGSLFLACRDDGALTRIAFVGEGTGAHPAAQLEAAGISLRPDRDALREARAQLDAYFYDGLQQFDLPLAPEGTPFQCAVWRLLQEIPYGACRAYGDLARDLGKPGASRAVGLANNRNPLPIVIPCHRVIGNNGRLVGFGGGTDTKHALLVHEGYLLL